MKKFLLFVAALVMVGSASAQSLRFYDEAGNLYEDGAVVESYEVEEAMMSNVLHINVKNTSDKAIDVMFDVTPEELTGFFQWCGNAAVTTGTCYPVTELKTYSYGPYTAAAGSADYYWHAALMCMAGNEAARVRIEVYDNNNPSDKTAIIVVLNADLYNKGLASVKSLQAAQDVKVFQRGANLVCNYNFDATANRTIVVSNIVGARVATIALNGNNGEVAFDRLPKGVYVYTLVENGRNAKSQKIVVR